MLNFKGGPNVKVAKLPLVKLLSTVHMLSVALDHEVARGDELIRLLLVGAMQRLVAAAEELARANKILWGTLESMPQTSEAPPAFSETLSTYAKPWRLCRAQVGVWAGMSDAPAKDVAAVSAVFEDETGASFLKGSDGASIWTRGDSKLRQLREAGAEALFRGRGMGELWESLEGAHARFGKAAGMTRVRSKRKQAKPTADAARAAVDAHLGAYVMKVCATEEPGQEKTAARAERLLTPYLEALAAFEEKREEKRAEKRAEEPENDTEKVAEPTKGEPAKPMQGAAGASVLPMRPSQRPPQPPQVATGT